MPTEWSQIPVLPGAFDDIDLGHRHMLISPTKKTAEPPIPGDPRDAPSSASDLFTLKRIPRIPHISASSHESKPRTPQKTRAGGNKSSCESLLNKMKPIIVHAAIDLARYYR